MISCTASRTTGNYYDPTTDDLLHDTKGNPITSEYVDEVAAEAERGYDLPDPDQAWFRTPEWQAGEREASEQIAAGEVTLHNSVEEFLAFLRGPTDE